MSHLIGVMGSTTEHNIVADSASTANTIVERGSSNEIAVGAMTASGLITGGLGLVMKSTNKTASFSASKTESLFYVCDTTAGSITVTLPAVASSNGVAFVFIKTVAANNLVLDEAGAATINGAATKTTATQYGSCLVWCDGTSYHQTAIVGTWT